MIVITRKQKVSMFYSEYYLKAKLSIKLLRWLAGPLVFFVGAYFFKYGEGKLALAYSGFCLIYGSYYTLKPYLWISLRRKAYSDSPLEIDMDDSKVSLSNEFTKNEILFSSFKSILERDWYYVLQIDKAKKVYLPKEILTDKQKRILTGKIQVRSTAKKVTKKAKR